MYKVSMMRTYLVFRPPVTQVGWIGIVVSVFAVFSCASLLQAGESTLEYLPSATAGKELSQKLCVNCHIVASSAGQIASDGVPTFSEIANRPNQTAQRVRQKLLKPSHLMPEILLTRDEMDDIIAYLDQLRSEAAGPDLMPPKAPKPDLDLREPS